MVMKRNVVLVVDDQPLMLGLVRAILEPTPYEVHTFQTPQEALEYVGGQNSRVDLLVSDVRLQGVCGPDLARAIRLERPDTAVLFMSGASLGASGLEVDFPHTFISKPFRPTEFLSCVESLLPVG
jgi:CheY-like chemotaxis protein